MSAGQVTSDHALYGAAKLITCILPDDGRDKDLLKALRAEYGILTANTFQCRGLGPGTEKKGKLTVSSVRVVTVVSPPEKVEELFEFIYFKVGFDHPIQEGSVMYVGDLLGATAFQLPPGVPEETEV